LQRFKHFLQWICLSVFIGTACGIASAVFLLSLEKATAFRESHLWLLWLLPFGGLLIGLLYHYLGKEVEGGNNLLIDEFHDPKKAIPFRMAPLVLIGTVITHLFGGSAGREGTAVQMGGSLADQCTHLFRLSHKHRKRLLMIGMSGGFGSVFGVPFAGTLFGIEVLSIGKIEYWAIVECAVASFVAHLVTIHLGVHHAVYFHPDVQGLLSLKTIFLAVAAGFCFGGAAWIFARLTDGISRLSKALTSFPPLRLFLGGAVVSAVFHGLPFSQRYSGLGVPLIVRSIEHPVEIYDWLGKLIMTALTLGFGFKGGEVTPLLFIGSTLGNALSVSGLFPLPLPLLAAMGFVGVFAGAANTPVASTLMAMEMFGWQTGPFVALACFASYAVSGHRGIYHAQRIHLPKSKSGSSDT